MSRRSRTSCAPAASAADARRRIARMLSSVRGLHRFLLDEGLVEVDAAAEVTPPKQSMRLPKAISIEQMAAVLAATDGDDIAGAARQGAARAAVRDRRPRLGGRRAQRRRRGRRRHRAAVRQGQQAAHRAGGQLRAGGDRRLSRAGAPDASRRAAPPTPALFLGARGHRVSRQNAWLIIRAAAERAKLGIDISPHTFRHSFATHLLAGGADVRVVQELLGHSSVATTQIYTMVTADTLRDMYTTAHPRAR